MKRVIFRPTGGEISDTNSNHKTRTRINADHNLYKIQLQKEKGACTGTAPTDCASITVVVILNSFLE